MAATGADTRKILEAITSAERSHQVSFNTLNISVASLQEKVLNISSQVTVLSSEVQAVRDGKASRSELSASEGRYDRSLSDLKAEFSKELARMESDVSKDVVGFQSMYESLVGEMKDLREQAVKDYNGIGSKLDSLIKSRDSLDEKIIGMDSRIKVLEPKVDTLRDTWLQMMGARWAVGLISAILSSGITAAIFKLFTK